MYLPASFSEERPEVLHGLIRAHPLGNMVSHDAKGLQASPLPFLLDAERGKLGTLLAHMARANPHWKSLVEAGECLVIFQGPNAYVTPGWYPSKADTHKVVPTWNYAAVHVFGQVRVIDDPDWISSQITALTAQHEACRATPWSPDDAPPDFIATQQQAIIGIEIAITHIEGKWKMSQNRNEADRYGVAAGMSDAEDPHHDSAVAKLIAERLNR